MKAFSPSITFAGDRATQEVVAEAAPARHRVRFLAFAIFTVLLLLAGRAVQLAFSGDPLGAPQRTGAVTAIPRADIIDRNGVLLATTVRAFALTAEPRLVWGASETADVLRRAFPELDHATLVRRLTDTSRRLVYLRRGLTPQQRQQVLSLGLAGIGFEAEDRRAYPQGELAAHALGFTDVDLNPLAGVERGLDQQIREAGQAGRQVRHSLDVRMQYALEVELAAAARAAGPAVRPCRPAAAARDRGPRDPSALRARPRVPAGRRARGPPRARRARGRHVGAPPVPRRLGAASRGTRTRSHSRGRACRRG